MKRCEVRKLKRAVADEGDMAAMNALLLRSVRLGHGRLALMRCVQAEQMGVEVAPDVIDYCRKIAEKMQSDELETVLRRVPTSSDDGTV